MDPADLGALAPPTGRIGNSPYEIQVIGGRYAIAPANDPQSAGSLDLAFGSGKTGMTFVNVQGSTISDAQMSYFPHLRRWYLTPGHSSRPAYVLGETYSAEFSRQCVLCHATTVSGRSVMPSREFLGVQCEACHGPAGEHVAAMAQRRSSDVRIGHLGAASAAVTNGRCGRCHGSISTAGAGSTVAPTHRFQTDGLEQSRCYLEGGRSLSCVQCHNPHQDADTSLPKYESVCLSCHSSRPTGNAVPANAPGVADAQPGPSTARACPVNARSGCIGCHMPRRRVFEDSPVPTYLFDHRIAVYRSDSRT